MRGRLVSALSGAGVAGVQVNAYAGADSWQVAGTTVSDPTGLYVLPLTPGSYILRFSPVPGSGLATIWSGGGLTRPDAGPVSPTIESEAVATTLPKGYVLSGRFPLANGCPLANTKIGSAFYAVGDERNTACKSDGTYYAFSLTVPAGSYYIRAGTGVVNGANWSLWWNANGTAVTGAQATLLRLAGDVSGININAP